ncbi:conserved hypothetical protein, partial [Trichinella spiralis]|uniref:hypothetical protein n=1 Tax=Trichinella spiralis TaxID=6334 RepID=UPI0001EFDA1D
MCAKVSVALLQNRHSFVPGRPRRFSARVAAVLERNFTAIMKFLPRARPFVNQAFPIVFPENFFPPTALVRLKKALVPFFSGKTRRAAFNDFSGPRADVPTFSMKDSSTRFERGSDDPAILAECLSACLKKKPPRRE